MKKIRKYVIIDYRTSLKTLSEKKQLCTASAASSPLVVRKHAFDGFSCIYCTYLLFLTQNGFLEMPLKPECEKTKKEKRKDKRAERWQNVKDFWGGVGSIGNAIKNLVIDVVEWVKENWVAIVTAIGVLLVLF